MKSLLSAHNFNHMTDYVLNKKLTNANANCVSTLTLLGKKLTFSNFLPNLFQMLFTLFPTVKWIRKSFAKHVQKVLIAYNKKAFHDLSNYIKNAHGKSVHDEVLKKHDSISPSMSFGEEIITPEKHRQVLRIALIESYKLRLYQHYSPREAQNIIDLHFTTDMQKGTHSLPKIKRQDVLQFIHKPEKLA